MRSRTARPRLAGRVLGLLRPHTGRLVAAVLVVVATVGLDIVSPLLLRSVINEALPRRDGTLLAVLCSGMLLIGVATSLATVIENGLVHRINQDVVHRLRTDVYDRVQAMPLEFFSEQSNTEIQARLASDIGGLSDTAGFAVQGVITSAVSLLATATVLVVLSWQLALASLLLAVGLNVVNGRFTTKAWVYSSERQRAVADMLKRVAEDLALPGVILGRTFGRHRAQRAQFEEISGRISTLAYRQRMAGSSSRAFVAASFACLPPLIYLLSGTVLSGLSLGTVVVLATLQSRLSSPIQYLLTLGGVTQSLRAMLERVFDFLDMEPGTDLSTQDAEPRESVAPALTVRSATVEYRTAHGRRALSDLSLDFAPGSTTLLVGSTGSGKSTLALLLAGLLAPTAGSVEVDGRPAEPHQLWRTVTLVSQDSAIFNASVRENLAFAEPDASTEDLERVLAAVALTDLLARLPDGLETVVGERGFQLSGGERQRLALARALLAPSPVLIVDEATSALDGETAEILNEAIRVHAAGRTLIVIAHRIPVLRPQDRVVVLAGGRIAEQGRHDRLSQTGVLYPEYLRIQALASQSQPAPEPVAEAAEAPAPATAATAQATALATALAAVR